MTKAVLKWLQQEHPDKPELTPTEHRLLTDLCLPFYESLEKIVFIPDTRPEKKLDLLYPGGQKIRGYLQIKYRVDPGYTMDDKVKSIAIPVVKNGMFSDFPPKAEYTPEELGF